MKNILNRMWQEDSGVLTFEWILLITLLVIGIVAGITAARDAIIDELGDIATAATSLDFSYSLAPDPCYGFGGAHYADPHSTVTRCARGTFSVQSGS